MKQIKKLSGVEVWEGTEQEVKDFCAALELKHGKLRYHRIDNVLTARVRTKRQVYTLVITDWKNNLLKSSNGGTNAISGNRFLGAQINYDGKPS